MGLVQREIEAAGLSTLTLSTIPDLTAAVGVPRLIGIEYPQGRPLGQPDDVAGQMAVLRAALAALGQLVEPGGRIDLPLEWPEPRSKVQTHPPDPVPIVELLKRQPWLLPRFIARDVPE